VKITTKMLKDAGACADQTAIFKKAWPKGCVVTLAACRRAVRLGLDLGWAAKHLLPAPAWKAYDEATAPAWKAYDEATAPAWKAYDEAMAISFYEASRLRVEEGK